MCLSAFASDRKSQIRQPERISAGERGAGKVQGSEPKKRKFLSGFFFAVFPPEFVLRNLHGINAPVAVSILVHALFEFFFFFD